MNMFAKPIKIVTDLHCMGSLLTPKEPHNLDVLELDAKGSLDELNKIVSSISKEHPYSSSLFKGKYQFFIWESLLPYQKPLGDIFGESIAVCVAKPKILRLGLEANITESSQRFGGMPLLVEFESFLDENTFAFETTQTALEVVTAKYDLYPLHESVGKKIMFMCSSLNDKWKFPVVSICHSADLKGDIFLGALKCNHKETRVIIEHKGSVCKQENLPMMSTLLSAHQGYLSSCATVQVSVAARYDFLEYKCNKDSELRPILDTSLVIECEWFKPKAVLEPIPPECKATVKIQSKEGDFDSGAYRTTREILKLEAFARCIELRHMEFSTSESIEDIEEQVRMLVEESRYPVSNEEHERIETSSQKNFDDIVMNDRKDLDFTDKLWLIIKEAKKLEPVVNAMKYVYKSLATEFEFSPYVSISNKSKLSYDIRNMHQKDLSCPDFDIPLVAKYLVEIGIDKLRKDFTNIFLSLEIASFTSFRKHLEPPLISGEAVSGLRKLQSILELAVVCVKRLDLSKEILTTVIRDALKHYEVEEFDSTHVFNFIISPIKARKLLDLMRPTIWEVSFLSNSNDVMKQSIHRYKTSALHEHVYAPKNYPLKLMLPKASYTYWKGMLLQTKQESKQ